MYDYLVSFIFDKDGYLTPCSGTFEISRQKKIKNFDDIHSIKRFIENKIDGARNVSIINIILIGRNKH